MSIVRSSPSPALSSTTRSREPSAPASKRATVKGVTNSMFSACRARSSMIADALNSSRRFTIFTSLANLARKVASSIAVSPPPTTTVGLSRKNEASQVAQ